MDNNNNIHDDNNVNAFKAHISEKINASNNATTAVERYVIINSIFADFLTVIGKRILHSEISTRESCVDMARQVQGTPELAVNANALLYYINSISLN
jgi:hypothetical protein